MGATLDGSAAVAHGRITIMLPVWRATCTEAQNGAKSPMHGSSWLKPLRPATGLVLYRRRALAFGTPHFAMRIAIGLPVKRNPVRPAWKPWQTTRCTPTTAATRQPRSQICPPWERQTTKRMMSPQALVLAADGIRYLCHCRTLCSPTHICSMQRIQPTQQTIIAAAWSSTTAFVVEVVELRLGRDETSAVFCGHCHGRTSDRTK